MLFILMMQITSTADVVHVESRKRKYDDVGAFNSVALFMVSLFTLRSFYCFFVDQEVDNCSRTACLCHVLPLWRTCAVYTGDRSMWAEHEQQNYHSILSFIYKTPEHHCTLLTLSFWPTSCSGDDIVQVFCLIYGSVSPSVTGNNKFVWPSCNALLVVVWWFCHQNIT